ncbi:hypothetical protein [Isoalcanivorax beigongshangi]|uniref:Tetratricopeptide repeat-containing protein n=1 Tax=Isoalcanivorax beigongshangi TaxID=3238810 RepID=A0ABV4AJY9_9GAMM
MRRITLSALAMAAMLSAAGCQVLTADGRATRAFERAEASGDLVQAHDLASRRRDQSALWLERDASVEQRISQLERNALQAAADAAALNNWHQALDSLDQALQQWPSSNRLKAERARLAQQERERLDPVRSRVYIAEAEWFAQQDSRLRELALASDPTTRSEVAALLARQTYVVERLLALGDEFAGLGQWLAARNALQAAARLDHSLERHPLLEQARQRLQQAQQSSQRQRGQALVEQARSRIARFQNSQDVADWVAAKQFIRDANAGELLSAEADTLRMLGQTRFDRDLATGDALYARGEYQRAYHIWLGIQPLNAEHEGLQNRLTRTRQVLDSLQELRNQR